MKVSPLVLLLGGMLVGALAWGSCNASRASDATKQLQALLAGRADSAQHWQRTRESLTVRLRWLQQDSVTLAAQYRVARGQVFRATDSLGKLLARFPDSTRPAVESTVVAFQQAISICEAMQGNCEQRAQNAERRAHGDSAQLHDTQVLLDTVRVRWAQAERKAQPSWLRDIWRSRSVTLPLAAALAIVLLSHR